jgi:hypothetical protein
MLMASSAAATVNRERSNFIAFSSLIHDVSKS